MYNDPNQPPQPSYDPTQYVPPQQPSYGQVHQPPNAYTQHAPPQGYPRYDVPPLPGNYMAPPPKKSLLWLWITLSVVGGLIVLSCIGCAVVGGFGINQIAQKEGGVIAATAYYQAIEKQDYASAYTYLDTTGTVMRQQVNQADFATAAQAVDGTKGTVTSATLATSAAQAPTTQNTSVTMSVTRDGQTYEVHLQLRKEGNEWKITDADGI